MQANGHKKLLIGLICKKKRRAVLLKYFNTHNL